ncbi:MAG: acyl-CoA dehydrogenase family protein [Chloroflexota bacterium]
MINSATNATPLELAQNLAQDFSTRADEADVTGKLPIEDVKALLNSGYLGISVPKEFGGFGLSLKECVAAHLTLAQGSASTAMVAGMQVHLFGHQRETLTWKPEWYARFCQEAALGGMFNAVASEPAMGSPSRGGLPATTAVLSKSGDSWLVNGRKTWTTGGEHLTHLLVRVSVNDQLGDVYIPQGTDGTIWHKNWQDALSLRASDSHDVEFANVEIPFENVIQQGPTKKAANVWFPLIMSTVYLGAAMAARHSVIKFALERVPTALGKPIATLPKIQRQIGEIDISLQAAQALLFDVAGSWTERDEDRPKMSARIAAAKTMVTETANDVTDKALRIAGGTSITKSLPLERHFRDVRAGSMQPPSGDTALEMVGRAAIGSV